MSYIFNAINLTIPAESVWVEVTFHEHHYLSNYFLSAEQF